MPMPPRQITAAAAKLAALTACCSPGTRLVRSLGRGFGFRHGCSKGTSPPRCAPTQASFGLPPLCGRREPAPGAYPLAVAEEDVGEGHQGQRDEGDEGRGPLVAEGFVHLDAEEGEGRWDGLVNRAQQPQGLKGGASAYLQRCT